MDWIALRNTAGKYFSKYKFALLILAAGLFLMSFPKEQAQKIPEAESAAVPEAVSLEQRLCGILGQIQGVGEVQVLLSEYSGPESVYQTDETGGSDGRSDTVIIQDSSRGESGLVKRELAPVYRGAVIVCQGGDNASVRLSVIEAVANATGISSSRITVVKMN